MTGETVASVLRRQLAADWELSNATKNAPGRGALQVITGRRGNAQKEVGPSLHRMQPLGLATIENDSTMTFQVCEFPEVHSWDMLARSLGS